MKEKTPSDAICAKQFSNFYATFRWINWKKINYQTPNQQKSRSSRTTFIVVVIWTCKFVDLDLFSSVNCYTAEQMIRRGIDDAKIHDRNN